VTRRFVLLSILSSVLCLAYFFILDRLFLSSRYFSPIFHLLLTSYDVQAAWLAVAVSFLAALWNRPAPILRLVDFLSDHPVGLALVIVVLTGLGSIFIYHSYPLCMDEYAALFQSKVFASGHVAAQLPPAMVNWLVNPAYNGAFLIASPETGRAIESYLPGFSLLLASFEFFSAPWLCNALLGGGAVYLMYRITLEITGDRRAAAWATIFGIASGAFFANAISYYSMQAHLTLNLLFAWLLLSPTRHRVLAAGLVGSFALVLHNPLPHLLFALPWVVAMAANKDLRRHLVPLVAGYLPITLALGLGWVILTRSIEPIGQGIPVVRTLASGVFRLPDINILNMRSAALAKMLIWAVPGLFVLAAWGSNRHSGNLHVRLLTQSAVLTFLGYLFVDLDQGHGWGYRYFHSAWGAIPILAACAMTGRSEADRRLVCFVGAACILSVLVIVPFQMSQIEHFISRHLSLLPPPIRPGNNVFFINPVGGFYIVDMIQTDPLLRVPDLLLASRGTDADTQFMRRTWPSAKKVGAGHWGEQWHLDPASPGSPTAAGVDNGRWTFDFGAAGK
jgi:hypothetical protein